MKESIISIYTELNFQHVLHVNAKSFYDRIATFDSCPYYLLQQLVKVTKESVVSHVSDALVWIRGRAHMADGTTKCNTQI